MQFVVALVAAALAPPALAAPFDFQQDQADIGEYQQGEDGSYDPTPDTAAWQNVGDQTTGDVSYDDSSSSSASNENNDYPLVRKRSVPTEAEKPTVAADAATTVEPESESRSASNTPTIALSDLIGVVEHAIVHSPDKLAALDVVTSTETASAVTEAASAAGSATETTAPSAVATAAASPSAAIATGTATVGAATTETLASADAATTDADPIIETSTVIALPILLPTPQTEATPATDDDDAAAAETAVTNAIESTATEVALTAPTTVPTLIQIGSNGDRPGGDNPANITILQTIESSQVHSATDSDEIERVQHQHITLFSAGAGVFPLIPSLNGDDPNAAAFIQKADSAEEGKSISSKSDESDENAGGCGDSSEESKSVESATEKCALEKTAGKASENAAAKKAAKVSLKEKIAEVQAEPVILTQGI